MVKFLLPLFGFSMVFVHASASESVVEQGRWLYLNSGGYGCAVCHGPVAEGAGQAGGAIRGVTLGQIETSLKSVAPMQPLSSVLTDDDRQSLAAYLNGLSSISFGTIRFNGNEWQGEFMLDATSKEVDLVIYNESFDAIEVDLKPFQLGIMGVAALERKSLRIINANVLEGLKHLDMKVTILEPTDSNVD